MIRTEPEYQEALKRLASDAAFEAIQRKELADYGLNAEKIERAMQPTISFNAQLKEEVAWYESVCQGRLEPITRLTNIGRILIALRIHKGMSQKDLADLLVVSEAQVSRDERNDYHGITVDRAQRILDKLNATLNIAATPDACPSREEVDRNCAEVVYYSQDRDVREETTELQLV